MKHVAFHVGDGDWIGVDTPTQRALLADIETRLATGAGFGVATLNMDHLVKLHESKAFRRAYAAQTHVVADGNPIVWLSHLVRRPVQLVPGCELVDPVCALAARHAAPVAMVGSTEAVLTCAAERLRADHAGLEVAATISPAYGFDPEGPEADACIEALARSGARICLVAMGAPKQEIFAARARAALPGMGFLSIGAGLDFITGAQKRAPVWVRRAKLEWLWRAATNPRRLAIRYARCAALLPWLAIDGMRGAHGAVRPGELQES